MPGTELSRAAISEKLQEIKLAEDHAKALADAIETKGDWLGADDLGTVVQDLYPDSIASGVNLLASGLVAKLMVRNGGASEFNGALWRALSDETLFADSLERESAFLFVLFDERLPYFQVDAVRMEGDEFRERAMALEDAIGKLRRLSQRPFAQKTEQGAAVLNLVLEHEDPRDRALLMGVYLSL